MGESDIVFALIGVGALLAGILPRLLEGRPLSTPIAFLGFGMLVFALPANLPDADPLAHPELVEHLTEIGVIVALMGAGLRIDRPLGWRSWSTTWRLLALAMPCTIAATAFVGWWAGLAPAAALLLGAALAPTDPVLASDVQVGEPTDREHSEDEVRFALTSEAGLNDGLAFPFVYLAVAVVTAGLAPSGWAGQWFAQDVLYRCAVGIIAGLLIGRLLGWLFFQARSATLRMAHHSEGFMALAATFLVYGLVELAGGYGFLGVFVAARAIRAAERSHEYHQVLHDFVEQTERLLTVLLLLLFGGAIVGGLLEPLTWPAALAGLALVFLIRPVLGWLSLLGCPVRPNQRWVIALFGIRGIGSFYYLAFGLTQVEFPQPELLWAIVGVVVLASIVLHGITATPAMRALDRTHKRSHGP